MKASSIRNEIESSASTINDYILSLLTGKPKELYQASSHYIKSGGKRLRPFMAIKSCETLGGNLKRALPPAAAVELVHNFSLVHDDIMDHDEMRHNVPSVHKYYGEPLAILAGDILFSKAFEILARGGKKAGIADPAISEMVARLSAACIEVCEGQAIDVDYALGTRLPNESQYIDMVSKKTAALFEVSCALGALAAPPSGHPEKGVSNMASFGRNIGIAFQLIDDLIGVVGDPKVTGKAVGNDIREGKKTYPILLALKNANAGDKDRILKVFGSKNASVEELRETVRIISNIGIDKEVRAAAGDYMDRGLKSIKEYSSNSKQALVSCARFIVERSL